MHGRRDPIVLTLGRISAKKGLDILIRAFARSEGARESRALLVIAGPDDENLTSALEFLAVDEGVGDSVIFTGMLRGADKLAALGAADVSALSSHTENFGVAVAEALAASRATVLSSAINIAPDAAAADAAVMVAPSVEPFASAITALLRDPERRRQMGARARSFSRRYDWDVVAPELAKMYQWAGREGV